MFVASVCLVRQSLRRCYYQFSDMHPRVWLRSLTRGSIGRSPLSVFPPPSLLSLLSSPFHQRWFSQLLTSIPAIFISCLQVSVYGWPMVCVTVTSSPYWMSLGIRPLAPQWTWPSHCTCCVVHLMVGTSGSQIICRELDRIVWPWLCWIIILSGEMLLLYHLS